MGVSSSHSIASVFLSPALTPNSTRWVKSVTILERASKLAFLDPEETSEYAKAHSAYSVALATHPSPPLPAPWLDQPKYRCPKDYRETKLALDQFVESMGVDGVFPVDRKRNAEIDGGEEPFISSHTILMVSRELRVGDGCPVEGGSDVTQGHRTRCCVVASLLRCVVASPWELWSRRSFQHSRGFLTVD